MLVISTVLFNHRTYLERFLTGVEALVKDNNGVHLLLQDNGSTDGSREVLEKWEKPDSVALIFNDVNLGYCAAHNVAITQALGRQAETFLFLNPDVWIDQEALRLMTQRLRSRSDLGAVTPLILRADKNLERVIPETIDAAGMMLTSDFRHLDRYSGDSFRELTLTSEEVFGGTGACLLCKVAMLRDLDLGTNALQLPPIGNLHPPVVQSSGQYLDEAFFAYREDADFAFRMQRRGWKCLFEPAAKVLHVRRVLPHNRRSLPWEVNALSVCNRILLLTQHFSTAMPWQVILRGYVVRNLMILIGVILTEPRSIRGIARGFRLTPRAWRQNKIIGDKTDGAWVRWFQTQGSEL